MDQDFHPNPQVRRQREAASADKKQPVKKEPAADNQDQGDIHGPAQSVEIQRKEDGSGFHSITRGADGNEDHQDHASYDEAEQHARSMHGEDGGDDMDDMDEDDLYPEGEGGY